MIRSVLRIILIAFLLAAGALAAQTVDGHAVNAVTGIDVPGVTVNLIQAGQVAYSATTDSQGHFRIEAVKAGHQLHWGESWLCKPPSCIGLSRQTRTNEKGEYSVTDLDVPGAWLLSAIAPSSWKPPESRGDRRLDWAQTFYPGLTDSQLAVRVMVLPGGQISNLDIELAAVPVHRIRGVVLDVSGNPMPNAAVTLSQASGSPVQIRNSRGDGTFEFESVAEGEWRISTSVEQGGIRLGATQWVQLKVRDWENLELRPAPPLRVQGRVVMEVPEGVIAPKPPSV